MNVNISTLNYWGIDSNVISYGQDFEDKSNQYFCLLNPHQDPPIFDRINLNFPNPKNSYECPNTSFFDNTDEQKVLKFTHKDDTIEVELEGPKSPLPSKPYPRDTLQDPLSREDQNLDVCKQEVEIRPYKCLRPQCNKTFLLKHHLVSHEKTHTGERPHVCSHCGKSFTHKYCLNTHLLLHTNQRPFQCGECNKRFTLKHHLMSHENVHKRDRPFRCTECSQSFPLKKQLITHEKFHKGERPFVCKECGDSFAQENHLIMHLRFHGSLTPFICRDCGAAFTRKFELDNHEKLHGKQPMICPICSKEFLQKRSLLTHLKTHENKLTCCICGNMFSNDKSLADHKATEHQCKEMATQVPKLFANKKPKINRNKNNFCDICFGKFTTKNGLTQHKKRQHNIGSSIYTCTVCQKSFREKCELLLHKHNVEVINKNKKC